MRIIKKGKRYPWIGKTISCSKCNFTAKLELKDCDSVKFYYKSAFGPNVFTLTCPNCSVSIEF